MKNLIAVIKNIRKNNFFLHSKNYLLAEIFNKGLAFFTIPIFTRLLSPEEYGILAIFTSIITIFTVFMGLSIQSSIVVKYYDHDDDFPEFLGTNIIFLVFNNVLMITICLVFCSQIASLFSIKEDIFIIAVVISSFICFIQSELSYLQASQRSKKYVRISVVRNFFVTLLAVIWTYLLHENRYYGNVYSQFLVLGIIFVFVLFSISRVANYNFRIKHLRYALLFSIPLIPHTLSGVILSQFDRVMINQFLGSHEVGLYSLAFNVGLLVAVFVGALNNAWVPIFFESLKNRSYDKIQSLAEKYSKVVLIAALGLILFSKEIIIIMADKQYIDAYKIVPIFALSGIINFLYTLFVNYSFYEKRTGFISIISLLTCSLNVLLNYIFIPRYGYAGAAWASLLSYILLFALNYCYVRFVLQLNTIKLNKIFFDILVLLIAFSVHLMFTSDNMFYDIIIKILLMVFTIIYFFKNELLFSSR